VGKLTRVGTEGQTREAEGQTREAKFFIEKLTARTQRFGFFLFLFLNLPTAKRMISNKAF